MIVALRQDKFAWAVPGIGLLLSALALGAFATAASAQEKELQAVKDRASEIAQIQDEMAHKQQELDKLYQLGDPWTFKPEHRKKIQTLETAVAASKTKLGASRQAYNSALDDFRKATAGLDALRKKAQSTRQYVLLTALDRSNKLRALQTIDKDLIRLAGTELPKLAAALESVHSMLVIARPIELIGKDLEEIVSSNPALKGLAAQFNDILKDLVQVPIPERPKAFMAKLGKTEKLFALLKNLAGTSDDPTKSKSMESLIALVDFMKELTPDEFAPAKGYITIMLATMESINESLKKLKLAEAAKNLDMLQIVAGYDYPLPTSQQPYPKELFGKFDPLAIDLCLVGKWQATQISFIDNNQHNMSGGTGFHVTFAADGTQTTDYSAMAPVSIDDDAHTYKGSATAHIATKDKVAKIDGPIAGLGVLIQPSRIHKEIPFMPTVSMGPGGLGSTDGDNQYICETDTLSYKASIGKGIGAARRWPPQFSVTLKRLAD